MNLSILQFALAVVLTLELASANHSLLAESSIPQFALAVVLLSDLSKLSIPQLAPLVLLSVSDPTRILSLSFNG